MSHVSDDVLAAIALGDPDVSPADREHVESCPVCSEEVAELASVHGLLRQEVGMRGAHRVDPGPQVWERVLAAISDEGTAETESVGSATPPRPLESVPPAEPVAPSPETRRATREGRAGSSNRPAWWLVAAAAALVVIGALVGRAVWAPGESSQSVVASVPLTTLTAAKQQEGTAQLLGGQSGQELRVDTQPMSPGSGYVEVWLINTDGKRMVSLGVLSGTQATFPVPANAIQQGYTIVDLSHEQFDDRPQHSGDSIMRGTLPV